MHDGQSPTSPTAQNTGKPTQKKRYDADMRKWPPPFHFQHYNSYLYLNKLLSILYKNKKLKYIYN